MGWGGERITWAVQAEWGVGQGAGGGWGAWGGGRLGGSERTARVCMQCKGCMCEDKWPACPRAFQGRLCRPCEAQARGQVLLPRRRPGDKDSPLCYAGGRTRAQRSD